MPTSADLIRMFSRKTAPAFELAIVLGAIAGGADDATCAPLAEFSRALGIAYQIGDDLQDAEQDGLGGRAVEQQPSMMLALLCEACTDAERDAVREALKQVSRAAATHDVMATLLARYGVVAAAEALREDYRCRALRALTPLCSVKLKRVLTRLVKRILPSTERVSDALARHFA